ncbi:hypothetical protein [Candidatus Agathobaculum pullicola]|uniref:hypothetical protein n=1 Tax=Candidatus Agathobaculum pullicola TaxID=2838426 RepID=UPI003F8EDD24
MDDFINKETLKKHITMGEKLFDSEVYCKLQQAEQEALLTGRRYSSKEVLSAMKDAIKSV